MMIAKIKEKIMQDRRIGRSSLEAILEILKEVEAEYGNGKTNADHIRKMSDEELADFLEEFEACDVCKYYDKNRCTFENLCVHEFAGIMIWEWLKSPTND